MTAKEYQEAIRKLEWDDLLQIWRHRNESPNIEKWGKGKFFEYAILRAFELEGAEVRYPYNVPTPNAIKGNTIVEQIDGVIYVDGLTILAESKDYQANVDIEPLAKLQVRLIRRPSPVIGCLFCASDFTWPTQVLIETLMPYTILLWTNDDIEYCLQNKSFVKGLKMKYRGVVEDGNHCLALSTYAQINQ